MAVFVGVVVLFFGTDDLTYPSRALLDVCVVRLRHGTVLERLGDEAGFPAGSEESGGAADVFG